MRAAAAHLEGEHDFSTFRGPDCHVRVYMDTCVISISTILSDFYCHSFFVSFCFCDYLYTSYIFHLVKIFSFFESPLLIQSLLSGTQPRETSWFHCRWRVTPPSSLGAWGHSCSHHYCCRAKISASNGKCVDILIHTRVSMCVYRHEKFVQDTRVSWAPFNLFFWYNTPSSHSVFLVFLDLQPLFLLLVHQCLLTRTQ